MTTMKTLLYRLYPIIIKSHIPFLRDLMATVENKPSVEVSVSQSRTHVAFTVLGPQEVLSEMAATIKILDLGLVQFKGQRVWFLIPKDRKSRAYGIRQ